MNEAPKSDSIYAPRGWHMTIVVTTSVLMWLCLLAPMLM